MADYFIYSRPETNGWGGDIAVISLLKGGLEKIGKTVKISSTIADANDCDRLVLTNTCLDQRSEAIRMLELKGKFFTINFHEDYLKYYLSCIGFYKFTIHKLLEASDGIDVLLENPSIVDYFGEVPPLNSVINHEVLKAASMNFPSSAQERETIVRDAPGARCTVNLLPTKYVHSQWDQDVDICNSYPLPKNFILQVGRLETRKNQLATVLACRNIDLPLVFIATKSRQSEYENAVIRLIRKYRKYRTYILSENLDDSDDGNLKIIRMNNGTKISYGLLRSAYLRSLVNVHPAFYELPGLTYIEAASLGIKSIYSSWSPIKEYFRIDDIGKLLLVDPRNICEIERAIVCALASSGSTVEKLIDITDDDFAKKFHLQAGIL